MHRKSRLSSTKILGKDGMPSTAVGLRPAIFASTGMEQESGSLLVRRLSVDAAARAPLKSGKYLAQLVCHSETTNHPQMQLEGCDYQPSKYLLRNCHQLHIRCAFVDLSNLRVAIELFRRIVTHESISAEYFHALTGDALGNL